MCAAAALSVAVGKLSDAERHRLVRLIERAGLPTRAVGVSPRAILEALRHDKKFIHGRPRWVLLQRLGQAVVTERVPEGMVRRVLSQHVT